MKRLLLVLDPEQPDVSSIELAAFLAKSGASKVEYLFPEAGNPLFLKTSGTRLVSSEKKQSGSMLAQSSDVFLSAESVAQGESLCLNHGLAATPLADKPLTPEAILTATRFADLVITSASLSAGGSPGSYPSGFLKELLEQAECPVMVAPERFEGWEELLFAFDGSRSAMFAIRQFTYLFPQLASRPAVLLEVSPDRQSDRPPTAPCLQWMRLNYPRLRHVLLQGTAEQGILEYLLKKENVLLVMGAYGRNTFSRFFRRSRADLLLRTLVPALFITHH